MANYTKTAPKALTKLHEEKKTFKGRDLLERLVTDASMDKSWGTLKSRIISTLGWHRFFREIVVISRQAKERMPSRHAIRKEFIDIAQQASALAQAIANGPLDRLAYEFFRDDIRSIAGAADWKVRNRAQQAELVRNALPVWPSMPDLLHEVASKADELATRATSENRMVGRNNRKAEALYFVRALSTYCRHEFGSPLFRVVTDIANVGCGYNLDLDYVEKAVRRMGT
jgi:hypothetical protein